MIITVRDNRGLFTYLIILILWFSELCLAVITARAEIKRRLKFFAGFLFSGILLYTEYNIS
jgi:hypothetical protein